MNRAIRAIRFCLDYLGQGGVEIIVNSLTMSEVFGFLTSDPCGTIICDALKELKGLAVRDVSVRKNTDSKRLNNIYGSFRFRIEYSFDAFGLLRNRHSVDGHPVCYLPCDWSVSFCHVVKHIYAIYG